MKGASDGLEHKAPECPDHLDARAKREWKRLVKMLLRVRILTEADGLVLANLCQAWSTLTKAPIKLNESGLLLKTPSGYVQQSPYWESSTAAQTR